jgi:formylglycine-generating enzyme required for sulfatase activity
LCDDAQTTENPGEPEPETVDVADEEVPPISCPKVQCESGSTAVYGLCVADAEVAFAGGTFQMGKEGSAADSPAHEVTVGAFTADRTEVSNRTYRACVECGVCAPPSRNGSFSGREPYYGNEAFDGYPVVYVTWDQAVAYCEGLGKRLPTEAEWEFMARGAAGRTYPWGEESPTSKRVNANWMVGDTTAVTDKADGATAEGVLNLAGNVWDWVHDAYDPMYYKSSPSQDPQGPDDGFSRVVRGGSFGSPLSFVTGYARASMFALDSYSNVGFRCVW